MYNIIIKNIKDKYEYNELIKLFISEDNFTSFTQDEYAAAESTVEEDRTLIEFNSARFNDKNQIKREIYQGLSQITGIRPPWGILTGVRPVKLTGELFNQLHSIEEVKNRLTNFFLLNDEKAQLLIDTFEYQQKVLGRTENGSVGIYIGIPFCPTRCLYCSFTSNQVSDGEIERYLEALLKEIDYVGHAMREKGLQAESIYIGGGTPTTLTASQLKDLIDAVKESFDMTGVKEFTVEAGRPDTITHEKLMVLKEAGVDRISINPQSMKAETLELIGRSHKPEDILKAFRLAKTVGITIINADLIAGLPEENPEDFRRTLEEIISLKAENITIHTLAVKRASRLIDVDKDFHYKQGKVVSEMLAISKEILKNEGYVPYYLYRQKHMAGSFENVGYCKGETPCIYNIRIMEEQQTIIALGAGGISKLYFPKENRLERIPNVSNYEIYISRIDEMLERKKLNLFKEVPEC